MASLGRTRRERTAGRGRVEDLTRQVDRMDLGSHREQESSSASDAEQESSSASDAESSNASSDDDDSDSASAEVDDGPIVVFIAASVNNTSQTGAYACAVPGHRGHDSNTVVNRGDDVSNQRGEFLAATQAIRIANEIDPNHQRELHIVSPNTDVTNTMNQWVDAWMRKSWRRPKNKPVANVDLIRAIREGDLRPWENITWLLPTTANDHQWAEEALRMANQAAP